MAPPPKTSWDEVADWYEAHLEFDQDSYQRRVILPNLLRLLTPLEQRRIADIACGSGFFSRALAEEGAAVVGIDLSPELIKRARARTAKSLPVSYAVAAAERLTPLVDQTMDAALIVLALQNMAAVKPVFSEAARVLRSGGELHLVLNHPAFRIPKASSWGWDEATKRQYRRLERYLSEGREAIQMRPGTSPGQVTWSFHRPLQVYFKALAAAGFTVTRLEEWISHKESGRGPRAAAENRARREFPLFLYLGAKLTD
jgi:ubiquinone/menaquinone biosynthesis C-methylase UbiE